MSPVPAAESILRAWCAGFGVIVLWGYGLSGFGMIASPFGWWPGAFAAALAATAAGRGGWRAVMASFQRLGGDCRTHPALAFVMGGVVVCLAAGIVTAMASAPSNWDSLAYQLARVGYYLQQGDLGDYGANFMSQEQHARGTSIVQCAIITLSGRSDALVEFPQIVAYLVCLVAVYALARGFGIGRIAAVAGAAVFGALTIAVMEVPTPQNDLVLASFIGCGWVGTLGFLSTGRRSSLVLASCGYALALSVKASALTAAPASGLMIVAVASLGSRAGRGMRQRRALTLSLATLAAIVVFAFPAGYVKNLQRFGNPLGGDEMFAHHTKMRTGEPGRLELGLMNLVRFTGDLFVVDGVPEAWAGATGATLKKAVGDRLASAGWDVERPVGINSVFSWSRPRWADENLSFFGWLGPAVLLPGCIGAIVLARKRPLVALAALAAGVFFTTQSFAGPYDPWRGRHFLYGAVFAVPAASWMFESRMALVRRWAWFAAIVGAAAVVPAVLWRSPNPLISRGHVRHVFALDRVEQMAVHHPSFPALSAFDRTVPPDATVIVALGGNQYEYVLFGPRLSRTLIPQRQWHENPELEDDADFLLHVRRAGNVPDPGEVDLGYNWSLRRLGGPIRPYDFTEVRGLYDIEDRFAWMSAEMQLRAGSRGAQFLNLEAGERFPPLAPSDHLELVVDGRTLRIPFSDDGRCAVSLPLAPGADHEIRLVSPTGAASPRSHGLSDDTRELAYRIHVLQMSEVARFSVPDQGSQANGVR